MDQAQNGTIRRPVPIVRNRLLTGAAVFVASIVLAAAAGLAIVSVPVAAPTAASAQKVDAADGWGPVMAERSAAKLARIEDGYLPGLLGGRNAGDAVDGWESSLIR